MYELAQTSGGCKKLQHKVFGGFSQIKKSKSDMYEQLTL